MFGVTVRSCWDSANTSTHPPAPMALHGGQGARTTHHSLGSTNSQKTLLFQVTKCNWSLWGTWQDGGRPGLGLGLGSAHYKNQRLL